MLVRSFEGAWLMVEEVRWDSVTESVYVVIFFQTCSIWHSVNSMGRSALKIYHLQ